MDTQTYHRCIDEHSDGVFRFALKHLRDRETARDIVQEAFLRLWKHLDRVDGAKAKSYLYTTAHHLIVDHAVRAERSTRFETWHEDALVTHQPDAGLKELIDRSLQALTPGQRTLVLLRDLEGFSYEEIGDMLGLDLTRVKVYLFRARQAMKRQLGPLELVI